MTDLVVKAFAGKKHYSTDTVGGRPLHKDSRWNEIDRIRIPDDMTLPEAQAAYEAGTLKRETPAEAKERKERRDRSWNISFPGPAFPTYLDDSKRDMDWEKHRLKK